MTMRLDVTPAPRVLVVDDERDDRAALVLWLERAGFVAVPAESAVIALEKLEVEDFDLVLTDLTMTQMNGLALCEHVLGRRPDVPVIIVTGQSSVEAVVSTLRAGAYDFITKPVDPELLTHSVARAAQHRRLHAELKRLREALPDESSKRELIGESTAMRRVHELIGRVADSNASVLIQGETGTGKELVARAIHLRSRRSKGPFVALNCAAVPHALLESELFGHARGAYTDAKGSRVGLMCQADGGTLFLDEIGDLPPEMQPKLLRALQERKVRPLGSNTEVAFDARIVTATNRDLEYEVSEKRFREDLFYRLNVVRVDLPPLRERGGDVLKLAQHFLSKWAKIDGKDALQLSASAAQKLMTYDWPGNVRELENCMERAVALARFDHLTIEDLPDKIRAYSVEHFAISANDATEILPLEEVERRYVLRAITLLGGNRTRAAEALGIDRRTLYRRLERYDSDSPPPTVPPKADA
jgi:two-component system response regulator HydG